MAPKRILIVLTSADKITKLDKPTGWYLPELAHPFDVLDPKFELVTASPKGGEAPLDPGSVSAFASDASCTNFLDKHADVYKKTRRLQDVSAADFDAVFYPGGHGPMYDLVDDAHSIRLIEEFWCAGKPVAAVCHGPIVFVRVAVDKGRVPLLSGKRVTGFTNAEEKDVGLLDAMPLLLEDEAKKCGCEWEQAAEPWGECVVVDGNLITGQNPASAKAVGEALAKALGV
ncbi:hypothetical protein XA68_13256 [Ophiocordyceps unilateralis]|uniref:D-lactate dehydratase n=1 Tax=Ophiocordyceps unilateralis TaxID=268505 RepID=A0A2A9PNQ7_OPHUN|nr:hypothetical protein XA68_13256 [Ophiocordyceps unilateralis]